MICLNPFGTGKCFKRSRRSWRLRLFSLNPFGTGKCFKRIQELEVKLLEVLIPSVQGNVSNKLANISPQDIPGLNPFGTGKCFKQMKTWAINPTRVS